MLHLLRRWLECLGAIGFTIILLLFLIVLIIIGTLEQKTMGLYQAQQQYFYAWFCFFPSTASIQVPFPGGALLFCLLFFNLLASFVVKFIYQWGKVGLWLCHIGLLLLLAGSFITFQFAQTGQLILEPNQTSQMVVHPNEWVLQWVDTTSLEFDSVYSFPEYKLQPGQRLTAEGCLLYLKVTQKTIAEYTVEVWDAQKKLASLVIPRTSNQWQEVKHQGCTYKISMAQKQWQIPFQIRLIQFTREQHPGTQIAKFFESKVMISDQNYEQQASIRMNAPLRYRGYTFYQSSYQPSMTNKTMYASVLAVVYNPAELLPYFSSVLILLGMIIHFLLKVVKFLHKTDQNNTNFYEPRTS